MKRFIIAIILLIFLIGLGIFEIYVVQHSSDICLENLEKIETLMENKKYSEAKKLSQENTENYISFSNNILYCFLNHENLDIIENSLIKINNDVENENIKKYKENLKNIKKQLLTVKQQELLTIQNIL